MTALLLADDAERRIDRKESRQQPESLMVIRLVFLLHATAKDPVRNQPEAVLGRRRSQPELFQGLERLGIGRQFRMDAAFRTRGVVRFVPFRWKEQVSCNGLL